MSNTSKDSASVRFPGVHEVVCRYLENHVNDIDKDLQRRVKDKDITGYVCISTLTEVIEGLHHTYVCYLLKTVTQDELKKAFQPYVSDGTLARIVNSRRAYKKLKITDDDSKQSYDIPSIIKNPIDRTLSAYSKKRNQREAAKIIRSKMQNGAEISVTNKSDDCISKLKIGKKIVAYKGYMGLWERYQEAQKENDGTPIEKKVIGFVKGSLDFPTLREINNIYRKEKSELAEPFISIEESVYEFTPEYEEKTERERKLLLQLSEAIIRRKVLKVTYQAPHREEPDELEFHPQYIRRVGRKMMVYGESKSIAHTTKYILVNLVFSRIKGDVEVMKDKEYRVPTVDYNGTFFADQMSFNAPALMEGTEMETVVLRVRKERKMSGDKTVYPFKRLLEEPLHHSQQQVYPHTTSQGTTYYDTAAPQVEDKEYGYVSLRIKDYMYIAPMLLSWGENIEVMQPDKLRTRMAAEIANMATMYKSATRNFLNLREISK